MHALPDTFSVWMPAVPLAQKILIQILEIVISVVGVDLGPLEEDSVKTAGLIGNGIGMTQLIR